jgi:hypothetical protein
MAKRKKKVLTPREELEQLTKRHKGILRPYDIVEFAADPSTALHAKFEWDDEVAAHEHRLTQARHLIRVYMKPVNNKPIRAWVSLTTDRGGDSYRLTEDVMANEVLRAQLLEDSKRDMVSFKNKYRNLSELAKVFEAMDDVE